MKIAFDAQPLFDGTKSGVGFHEDGLISALLKNQTDNTYFFEFFSLRNHEKKEKILSKYKRNNVYFYHCKWIPGVLYKMVSVLFPMPHRWLFPESKDITHFFNYYIPPFVKGKKVVTIHDMAFRVFPETVRKKTFLFLKSVIKKSIKRADHIVTVSEFSKQEIMRFYHVPSEKISVVPNGVDLKRFRSEKDKDVIEKVKEKYEVSGEYFLYLGTLEPRKNLVRLILAYAVARKEYADFPTLVLAGGKGWMYDEIFQTVEQLNLQHMVLFPGYIADEDVAVLLSGAKAFVFPSLYEGFGMPVIEAMACGVPVLTSNGSALKEIAYDAAVLVNVYDIDEIEKALVLLSGDEQLRCRLIEKVLKKSKEFSWNRSTDILYKVYQELTNID